MNKENCALKLVDEIILYYDARSEKHQRATKRTYCVLSSYFLQRVVCNFQNVTCYFRSKTNRDALRKKSYNHKNIDTRAVGKM